MAPNQFDAPCWVRRLSEAIDRVLTYERQWENALRLRRSEESSAMGLPSGIHDDTRRERINQYSRLRPDRGAGQLGQYGKSLLALLASVEEAVLEHPIIKDRLIRSDDFTGIRVYSPSSRFHMSTSQIVEGILSYAVDCGALEAASALEERIRLGEEGNLVGRFTNPGRGRRVPKGTPAPQATFEYM